MTTRRTFLASLFALPAAAVAVVKRPELRPGGNESIQLYPEDTDMVLVRVSPYDHAEVMHQAIIRRIAETNPYMALFRK